MLSAFEPSDARFEALATGVWHAGGVASVAAERDAPTVRVMVTLANGHQKVHDLPDDGALRDARGSLDERFVDL